MSRSSRRYEILLPLRFNDGQAVPPELIADTLFELKDRFGAVSSETQTIRGFWTQKGQTYRDDLTRLFVDVEDSPENREFFVEFKERLKTRFKQIDIWLTAYPIDMI